MSFKHFFPMILLVANLASAQTGDLAFHAAGTPANPASIGTNNDAATRATFQQFVDDVLNRKNLAAAKQYFAPLFRHHSLPEELQPVPVEAYQSWQKSFNTAFPDARWTIDYLTVSNGIVSYHLTMHATHQGAYAGIPATGHPVTTTETGIMRLENGKIAECWATFDDQAVLKAIGKK